MHNKIIFTQATAIRRFIYAIENKLFVEAHELLEEDWKSYKKNGELEKAKALKGLINGATALALYFIKNRPEGYKKVWSTFQKYVHLLEKVDLVEREKYLEARDLLIKINNSINFKI